MAITEIDSESLRYWSELVKLRAMFRCEYPGCGFYGRIDTLESHHFVSKRILSLRFDPEVGICLCHGHHSDTPAAAHGGDGSFRSVIIEGLNGYPPARSREWLDYIVNKKRQVEKADLSWYLQTREKLYERLIVERDRWAAFESEERKRK